MIELAEDFVRIVSCVQQGGHKEFGLT